MEPPNLSIRIPRHTYSVSGPLFFLSRRPQLTPACLIQAGLPLPFLNRPFCLLQLFIGRRLPSPRPFYLFFYRLFIGQSCCVHPYFFSSTISSSFFLFLIVAAPEIAGCLVVPYSAPSYGQRTSPFLSSLFLPSDCRPRSLSPPFLSLPPPKAVVCRLCLYPPPP